MQAVCGVYRCTSHLQILVSLLKKEDLGAVYLTWALPAQVKRHPCLPAVSSFILCNLDMSETASALLHLLMLLEPTVTENPHTSAFVFVLGLG